MTIKEQLQIIVITYNRKQHLKKTFEQFILDSKSPVKDFDILVLDNNSTDDTEKYINSLINKYKNIKYQKNKYNLGISGNIAKAMEIASKEYLWIICDDDKYDWTNFNEVENAVNNKEQVICVARYAIPENNTNNVDYQLLQLTFVPSIILNTSILNDVSMRNSFDNIFTLFPHLCPIISYINKNGKIYVIDKPIVDNGMDIINTDSSYTRGVIKTEELSQRTKTMSWIVGYANICSMINNKQLKHKSMITAINYIHGSFKQFSYFISTKYMNQENWIHIIDSYLPLNAICKIQLILMFFAVKLFSCYAQDNFVIIKILFIKIKLKIHYEDKYKVFSFLGFRIKKDIKNKSILLNIFNKEFKLKK